MAGKRFRAGQVIMKLREAEVGLAQGQRVGQVSKQMGVSEQTYYRWRKEGTVKLSGIPGFWRRNRSSVERRINNLGTCQGAD